MSKVTELYDAILCGNLKLAVEVTETALKGGADPKALVDTYMIPAMDEVGRRFEANEYFVPELLIAARAMKGALQLVRPLLLAQKVQPVGRVAIGTVKGDLHDIGKNLVAAMLEGGGFEIVDLGVDVSAEKFVQAIKEKQVNVVCLSALLTTTMPGMKDIIKAIEDAGARQRVKILVGGAPVTRQYADQIGADGFSDNASGAVAEARKLLGIAAH
ncbi:MAG: corrinoid protein [Lentisphaerae bacterium]|nr:corrinoid protein [Lentisphaerota bacterium]